MNSTDIVMFTQNGTEISCNDEVFSNNLNTTTSIIWGIIAIIGIFANGTVLVVIFLASKLTSATQYFIINLALSDLIFLAICPTFLIMNYQTRIYNHLPFILGKMICKLDYFLTHLTVFITCLTLMSMTFDRYLVIMDPLKAMRFRTTKKAVLTNVSIWIISTILCLPFARFRVIEQFANNSYECVNSEELDIFLFHLFNIEFNWDRLLLIYKITISYMSPLFTIIICYLLMFRRLSQKSKLLRQDAYDQQKRRRVLMMIGIVSILFGLCWGPIHIIHIYLKFKENFNFCSRWLFAFKSMAHTLTFLNSMLNPFFYTIIGNNFRSQVKQQRQKYSSKFRNKTRVPSLNVNNINYNSHHESIELNNAQNGLHKNNECKRLSFLIDNQRQT